MITDTKNFVLLSQIVDGVARWGGIKYVEGVLMEKGIAENVVLTKMNLIRRQNLALIRRICVLECEEITEKMQKMSSYVQ